MGDEKLNEIQKLAEEVLVLSRNTLLVNLRFLDAALSRFKMIPIEEFSLLTDGYYLLYNPKYVLTNFKEQKETITRDYLHIVLHCIYRHMFIDPTLDRPLWDLACDIAVENVITDLGLKSADAHREATQSTDIAKFQKECKMLTAEKIYAYLKSNNIDPVTATDIRSKFYADNHEIWYMTSDQKTEKYGISNNPNDKDKNQEDRDEDKQENLNGNSYDRKALNDENNAKNLTTAELNEIWQQISERIQVDIEIFGKQRGNVPSGLVQNLKEVNREKYDYASFLKKFAVMGEVLKINDDEFDYIFYTYGLKLYDKMPLIEPLEYREVKRIKEFVIAIDTSASVIGEQVQAFVQKTYNILKSTESFFSKINLHIIQCDADIQEHIKITTQDEFDNYLKNMTLKGFGGTDFRPVFTVVDELIRKKEFINLKGLIYFTDGDGVFPEYKPSYNTAFVFVKDDYEIPEVPSWAIKLILEPNDILQKM